MPDKSTEVILYCGGGFRSALAADVLQHMGYTNVFSMAGGWKAWKESGAPVEATRKSGYRTEEREQAHFPTERFSYWLVQF